MLGNPNYVCGSNNVWVPAKLNFGEYMLEKLLCQKEKVAIINAATHEKLTYGQIAQQSMNLAVSLSHIGVRKGQIVALCSENRQEFWSTVVGVVCTGAVLTTVNVGYTKNEFKHVMNISKPRYVICSPLFYNTHKDSIKSLSYIETVILYGDERRDRALLYSDLAVAATGGAVAAVADRVVADNAVANNGKVLQRDVRCEEFQAADVEGQTDTLFILYSSGTTGLPKGVMLTHLNVLTSCCSFKTEYFLILVIAPWFHAMGLIGALEAMSVGKTLVYLVKFDMELYLQAIEKYKITQLTVVPAILVALSKTTTQRDVTSVKMIYCGAAPLYRETLIAVHAKFPNLEAVLQGYGMTESTLGVARHIEVGGISKPGGVGPIVASSVVKVVDVETRKPLGPNQTGEICVKGFLVMKGYVGMDKTEGFDDEGFFKTGDIGYYDDERIFFIVDRLKELIKYKGYQIAPAELEAVLLQHPAVRDAGVIGLPHREAGEVPMAFVVTQPGAMLTDTELKNFVAERLSNPKHLRGGVRFVDQIPRNPSGKILRRLLRDMARTDKSKL